jgi:hypothetical protein
MSGWDGGILSLFDILNFTVTTSVKLMVTKQGVTFSPCGSRCGDSIQAQIYVLALPVTQSSADQTTLVLGTAPSGTPGSLLVFCVA